jgi:hypothetical protein
MLKIMPKYNLAAAAAAAAAGEVPSHPRAVDAVPPLSGVPCTLDSTRSAVVAAQLKSKRADGPERT